MQLFAQEAVLTVITQLGNPARAQQLHDALLDSDDARAIAVLRTVCRSEKARGDEADTELLRSSEEALDLLLHPVESTEEPDALDAQVALITAGW